MLKSLNERSELQEKAGHQGRQWSEWPCTSNFLQKQTINSRNVKSSNHATPECTLPNTFSTSAVTR